MYVSLCLQCPLANGLSDWQRIKSGDYVDPFGLKLSTTAEYNTRYFPRLCLEEEPSVDMSTHNTVPETAGRNALNDQATYLQQREQFRNELERFNWVNPHVFTSWSDDASDSETSAGEQAAEEVLTDALLGTERLADHITSLTLDLPDDAESAITLDSDRDVGLCPSFQSTAEVPAEEALDSKSQAHISSVKVEEKVAVVSDEPLVVTPTLGTVALDNMVSPSPLSTRHHAQENGVISDQEVVASSCPSESPRTPSLASPNVMSIALPISPVETFSESGSEQAADGLCHRGSPTPIPVQDTSSLELRLPTGLPASGLSVSDFISVPSLGTEQMRIKRRNQHLASPDTIPASRLSVELNGTITQLGEDDWDALSMEGEIPSAPNGSDGNGNGSFLNRLRRRPSTIITSGLKRQIKTSDGDDETSREPSPTKGLTTPRLLARSTKRALGKFKVFPRLRTRRSDRSQSGDGVQETRSPVKSPPADHDRNFPRRFAKEISPSPDRPLPARRHTEAGLIEKRIASTSGKNGEDKISHSIGQLFGSGGTKSVHGSEVNAKKERQSERKADVIISAPASMASEPRHQQSQTGLVGDGSVCKDVSEVREVIAEHQWPTPKAELFEDSLDPLVWEYGEIETGIERLSGAK